MANENDAAEAATGTEENESVLDEAVNKAREQREEKVPHTIIEEKPLPKSMRQVVVEVPADEWSRRVGEFFKDLQHKASIEGFRKGKAPVKLLERRFMKEASNELIEKITPAIVREYEQAKSLTLYGVPTVSDYKAEVGQPARITIEVEVKPEIEPSNYSGVEVEAPETKLTDEMVENRINEMRARNATWVEADRALEGKDAAVVDLKGVNDKGHTIVQETDKFYEDPHEQLPHEVVHQLFGKKAGETIEVTDMNKDKSGEKLKYTVTLKAVKGLNTPELDDEFAKDLGHDSVAALKAAIKADLQKMVDSINADEAFDAITDKLVEAHDFEVPPALKDHVLRDLARQDMAYFNQTGLTPPRLRGKNRGDYREELEKSAEKRVRGFLLIDAIGKKEKIEAAEEDINAALEARGQQEGRKAVAIRAALERRKELEQFTDQVRFDKIRAFLLSKSKIKFVDPKKEETSKEEAPKESAPKEAAPAAEVVEKKASTKAAAKPAAKKAPKAK